jgi:hypothetical protein
LHSDNFATKFVFNKLLEIKKHLVDIIMLLEEVDLSKFTMIIDKAYIT